MEEFKILRPKIFLKGRERFVKIKVEFVLEVYVGDQYIDSPKQLTLNDVENALDNTSLSQLGEELIENLDVSQTIMEND